MFQRIVNSISRTYSKAQTHRKRKNDSNLSFQQNPSSDDLFNSSSRYNQYFSQLDMGKSMDIGLDFYDWNFWVKTAPQKTPNYYSQQLIPSQFQNTYHQSIEKLRA